jgi:ABC-type transport system involved in multi-copper enzyme maturation permease subunit
MPIHDQTYRRYEGTRAAVGRGWLVILRAGVRGLLTRRVFVGLLVLSWLPWLVRTVQIWAVATYPAASQVAPVDVRLFMHFLEQQDVFVFFVAVYAGAGLVANDRRANALPLYLSKPLLRAEYIAGKLGVLVLFLLGITLAPALLLVLMQVLFAGSWVFLRENAFLLPAILLASLTTVFVTSITMLALSSLSRSARYVAVLFAGAIFFTNAIYGVLRVITGSSRMAWVSITANLEQVIDVAFRQTPRYDTPVAVSILVLVGLVVLSLSVLERRIRAVEVVS